MLKKHNFSADITRSVLPNSVSSSSHWTNSDRLSATTTTIGVIFDGTLSLKIFLLKCAFAAGFHNKLYLSKIRDNLSRDLTSRLYMSWVLRLL